MKIIDIQLDQVNLVKNNGGKSTLKNLKDNILVGDWDLDVIQHTEFDRFQFCYNRFINKMTWESTGAINRGRRLIKRRGNSDGHTTILDVIHRYNKLDKLYNYFKNGGEIINYDENNLPLFFHISRNNEIIFSHWNGCHRFSMFKLLGIKQIKGAVGFIHPDADLSKFKIEEIQDPTWPNILIVGSGQSVLNYEFEKLINGFNAVVRFNGFQRNKNNKFENFIGSKTDIVIANTSVLTLSDIVTNKNIVKNAKYIITQNTKIKDSLNDRRPLIIDELKKNKIEILDEVYVNKNNPKALLNKSMSSGLTIILYFLNTYSKVAIHGFDLIDDFNKYKNQTQLRHYFDEDDLPSTFLSKHTHSMNIESRIIFDLIKEGKVVELKNL